MAALGRSGPGPRSALPAWKREILERKRAKLAALGGGAGPGAAEPEQRVLAESLGPLRENPFMRLEAERRRGAGAAGARLLERYNRVPGVRALRADSVLIIETVPGFPPAPPAAGAAQIRAAEVLVYGAPPGRVSRLLERFDSPTAPRRRGSPERARPPPPPPAPPRPPPAAPSLPAAPGPCSGGASPGSRRSDFLQKTGSNSFTVHPRGLHRGAGARLLSNGPSAAQSQASPANGLAGSPLGSGQWKPKVEPGDPSLHPPPSPGIPSATPAAPPASATPSQRQCVSAATSANDSFEIRPAPKPDVETIPSGDLQARALASLRANSRNSFLFIPKSKASGAPPAEERPSAELPKGDVGQSTPSQELGAQLVPGGDGSPALVKSTLEVEAQWAVDEGPCPRAATALSDRAVRWQRPSSPPPFLPAAAKEAEPAEGFSVPGLAKNSRGQGRPGLPVTFIDEVDSEDEAPQEAKLPYSTNPARPGCVAELQPRGSNTFTVVPKRKPGPLQEQHLSQANGGPQPREAEEEEAGGLLGPTLKKRYPAVHEIEVIGGYLALQKSCLTKAGSSRKKVSGGGRATGQERDSSQSCGGTASALIPGLVAGAKDGFYMDWRRAGAGWAVPGPGPQWNPLTWAVGTAGLLCASKGCWRVPGQTVLCLLPVLVAHLELARRACPFVSPAGRSRPELVGSSLGLALRRWPRMVSWRPSCMGARCQDVSGKRPVLGVGWVPS
ncbi:hypothetical protein P7K49_002177 [Saguinus oedipus]|uniref:Taperin n=1 Tax=Saguinus oedipus TaxID=9490 RepID=A0ABQ9WGN0_SAGOE|nr:hypothetical protein P7K49_002177 [Saguinus oedipus]